MSNNNIPWDAIPEGGRREALPDGLYTCEVESLEETTSKAGARMFAGVYRVLEPTEYAGRVLYEYHNIGTDKDPLAEDPKTWAAAIGARTLRDLVVACGVPQEPNAARLSTILKGQRFMQQVQRYIEPEKKANGQDNPYAGQPANRMGRRFRVGDGGSAARTSTAPRPIHGGTDIVSPFTGEPVDRSTMGRNL